MKFLFYLLYYFRYNALSIGEPNTPSSPTALIPQTTNMKIGDAQEFRGIWNVDQ